MEDNNTTILSTRPVEPALVALAAGRGITLEAISFIETEAILPDSAAVSELANLYKQAANVVFTSMNAVDAVCAKKAALKTGEENPAWRIFCIGQATRQRVIDYFGEGAIAGSADSASALAGVIVKFFDKQRSDSLKTAFTAPVSPKVVFFCGDQRRDELPGRLRKDSIEVVERIVYRTTGTPHLLKKQYDGILFFSPSAVDSFFRNNTLPEFTVLFSIGTTTAAAIAGHASNRVIVSALPAKEMLIRQALDFFSKP